MKEYSVKKHDVGLDVHADSIAVAVADSGRAGEVRDDGVIHNTREDIRKLLKKLGPLDRLHVCYEAGPCGYELYWQMVELGVACEVVAPSLIPQKSGDRIKTDRRDARKLARCLRAGELTAVWVPDKGHEALRELVRLRHAVVADRRRARQRLGHFLLRHGRRFSGRNRKWGPVHMQWVRTQRFEHASLTCAHSDLLHALEYQNERIVRVEAHIDDAVQRAPAQTQELIAALQALRGVAKVVATTVAAELGELRRFSHPLQLMSYLGLVPREHSSGASVRRGSITKTGNVWVRTALVEAAWSYRHKPSRSLALKRRQAGCSPEVLDISWKAQHRLHSRYTHLTAHRKRSGVAVTAVARELAAFVWDIGRCVEQRRQGASR